MATISLPGQLVRTRRFTLGVPEQFTVALDGHQAMGVAITENLLTHQVRFLQRHLGVDPAGAECLAGRKDAVA